MITKLQNLQHPRGLGNVRLYSNGEEEEIMNQGKPKIWGGKRGSEPAKKVDRERKTTCKLVRKYALARKLASGGEEKKKV